MEPREVLFENDLLLSDTQVKTIDVNVTDPITEILVTLRATNSTTSNKANPIWHNVKSIQLVDGGDVLWNVTGIELMSFFANYEAKLPHYKLSEIASDSQYVTIPLPFGRWLYDQDYAFNPVNFKNPQIKIDWAAGNVNAVGVTGFATGTSYLTVMARLMQGVNPPRAMLTLKEYDNYTSAASGDATTELPTDRVWRALMYRAYKSGVALNTSITNLKLSLDGDKFVPFNYSVPKFWREMATKLGLFDVRGLAMADDNTAFENWIAFSQSGMVSARASGIVVGADNYDNSQVTPHVVNHAGTTQTGQGVWWSVLGTSFENSVLYPFGRKDEPADWFNLNIYKSAKLKATQGNAGASCQVVLQEVRPY